VYGRPVAAFGEAKGCRMTEGLSASGFPNALLDFRIRRVQQGDAEALLRFYSNLPEQSRFFFEPYPGVSAETMNIVVERSERGLDRAFAAVHNGEFLAHFFIMGAEEAVPHIGLGMAEAYQGYGLGSVFLAYLLSVARYELRKEAVGLTVMKENARAVKLYCKHGFQIARADVSFRGPQDSYEMRKDFAHV